MAIKRTSGERAFDVINAIVMILLALICLYPLFHVLFSSFSDPAALMVAEDRCPAWTSPVTGLPMVMWRWR